MEQVKVMDKIFHTDYLISTGSYEIGAGSIGNFFGGYYSFNTMDKADEKAIEQDWKMVGQDLKQVLSDHAKTN